MSNMTSYVSIESLANVVFDKYIILAMLYNFIMYMQCISNVYNFSNEWPRADYCQTTEGCSIDFFTRFNAMARAK